MILSNIFSQKYPDKELFLKNIIHFNAVMRCPFKRKN